VFIVPRLPAFKVFIGFSVYATGEAALAR